MPDSEGRTMGEADIAEAQAEFDYRKRAFHDTLAPLANAMHELVQAHAKHRFPDATKVVLYGEMNEMSELSVRVTAVHLPNEVLTADSDLAWALDEFEGACEDVLSYCDIFGDDYYNETEIDL